MIDYYLPEPLVIDITSDEPIGRNNINITTVAESQEFVPDATITTIPSQSGYDGTTTRNLPIKYNDTHLKYYTSSKATSNGQRQLWKINFNNPDDPKELMVNITCNISGNGFNSGRLTEIIQDGTIVKTNSFNSNNTAKAIKSSFFHSEVKVSGENEIKFYTTELSNNSGSTYTIDGYGSLSYIIPIDKNGQPMYLNLSGYKFSEDEFALDIQCAPLEAQNDTTWGTMTITDNIITNITKGGTIDN